MYIREAHPEDGWKVQRNSAEGISIKQPKTEAERSEVATVCATKLALSFPCVIDGLDNKVEAAYAGWPDRLYIVGKDGKIAYKGEPGPRGFKVDEMNAKLKEVLSK